VINSITFSDVEHLALRPYPIAALRPTISTNLSNAFPYPQAFDISNPSSSDLPSLQHDHRRSKKVSDEFEIRGLALRHQYSPPLEQFQPYFKRSSIPVR